jgi:hypothetical protein
MRSSDAARPPPPGRAPPPPGRAPSHTAHADAAASFLRVQAGHTHGPPAAVDGVAGGAVGAEGAEGAGAGSGVVPAARVSTTVSPDVTTVLKATSRSAPHLE